MAQRQDKSKGWLLLYIFSGGMDLIQFVFIELILGWFGVGVVVNEIIDPIVGIIIGCWIQFGKKVSLISRPKRIISMFGTEAVGALTGGIAQLWVLDVWYIHNDVKKEEAELKAQEAKDLAIQSSNGEQNIDGTRYPRNPYNTSMQGPVNKDGVRLPRGGMRPINSRIALPDTKPPIIK